MVYTNEFREVLDYIYSFTVNGRKSRKKNGDFQPPTLARMQSLMDYLDYPQNAYPIIHIAGTKGKGSTANFIANTLVQAGYRIGLFISPHLFDFSERIQVNGRLIPHSEVADFVKKIKPFLESNPGVSTFEIITAMAFDYFRNQNVDIAIIEVGLGGRFDATNVVSPLLSVITSISFDHMDLLGETLEEIAFEKAGIIKQGVPVVVGKQPEAVYKVLKSVAHQKSSTFVEAIKRSEISVRTSNTGHSLRILENRSNAIDIMIPLLGYHQVENALLAYTAILELQQLGILIDQQAVLTGFHTVDWPARFEIISEQPPIIVDGAHNVDSIRRVLEIMHVVFPEDKLHVLFGVSKGKDAEGMLKLLLPESTSVVFSKSTHPKSVEPSALVQLANQFGFPVEQAPTMEEALRKALDALDDQSVLLCTGSLFIAAAARDVWKSINKR